MPEPRVTFITRVEADTAEWLRRRAEREDRSLSVELRVMIRDARERDVEERIEATR